MKETIIDKNFRILGYYRKSLNCTTNVSGTILARCDAAVCLLFECEF